MVRSWVYHALCTDLFKLLGLEGENESLLVTAVFGIVKFIAALICSLFLVDYIGRKRVLLIRISLQVFSIIYIAGFLTAILKIGMVDSF